MASCGWDESLLQDYLAEVSDLLDGLESSLLHMGEQEEDPLDAIYRALHTTKGLAATFGFDPVVEVAHAAEEIIRAVQESALRLSCDDCALLLQVVDRLRTQQQCIAESQPPQADPALVATLRAHAEALKTGERSAAQVDSSAEPASRPDAAGDQADQEASEPAADGTDRVNVRPAPGRISYIRVPESKVDVLVEAVGLAGVYLDEFASLFRSSGDADGAGLIEQMKGMLTNLERAIGTASEAASSLRAVPVRNVFRQLERAAWEVSRRTGKSVGLDLNDNGVEIDQVVLGEITEALLHIIRNAVDHGIESPEERASKGKPAKGTVRLICRTEPERFVFEISDDGRGLDWEKIRSKAVEKGLISQEQAANLTAAELTRFIFRSGFSTAERITDVSGRGVGMDAVAEAVARLGGKVEVQSEPGRGCTFTITLPKTQVAYKAKLQDVLVVGLNGAQYAIPADRVVRLLDAAHLTAGSGGAVSLACDRQLGLFGRLRLADLLRMDDDSSGDKTVTVVVRSRLGLVGLEVPGRPRWLRVLPNDSEAWGFSAAGICGGAVLPDGSVCLLLDIDELLAARGCTSAEADRFSRAAC